MKPSDMMRENINDTAKDILYNRQGTCDRF